MGPFKALGSIVWPAADTPNGRPLVRRTSMACTLEEMPVALVRKGDHVS